MLMPIHMLKNPSHAPRLNPSLSSNHTTKPTNYISFLLEPNPKPKPPLSSTPHSRFKAPKISFFSPKRKLQNHEIKIPFLSLHLLNQKCHFYFFESSRFPAHFHISSNKKNQIKTIPKVKKSSRHQGSHSSPRNFQKTKLSTLDFYPF